MSYCLYQWRRKWQPTPVLLPGESHGWRSLVGYIQSMGLQRVRHDGSEWARMPAFIKNWPSMFWDTLKHVSRDVFKSFPLRDFPKQEFFGIHKVMIDRRNLKKPNKFYLFKVSTLQVLVLLTESKCDHIFVYHWRLFIKSMQ